MNGGLVMADELIGFSWARPKQGFYWTEIHVLASDVRVRVLTSGIPLNRAPKAEQLEIAEPLLEHSGLFRTFAALEPTEERILRFANKYGSLGFQHGLFTMDNPECPGSEIPVSGELQSEWTQCISEMRWIVQLWDWIQADNYRQLSEYVRWQGMDHVTVDSHPYLPADAELAPPVLRIASTLSTDELTSHAAPSFRPGFDVYWPAVVTVYRAVTGHLWRRVSPELTWDDRGKKMALRFEPDNLHDAMWLQFARAIHGQYEYRSCGDCGEWFRLDPSIARSNRKFCSDVCKVRAYRKRKNKQMSVADADTQSSA